MSDRPADVWELGFTTATVVRRIRSSQRTMMSRLRARARTSARLAAANRRDTALARSFLRPVAARLASTASLEFSLATLRESYSGTGPWEPHRSRSPTCTSRIPSAPVSSTAAAPRHATARHGGSGSTTRSTRPASSTNAQEIAIRIPQVCTDEHGASHNPSPAVRSVVPNSPTNRADQRSATWHRGTTISSPRTIGTIRGQVRSMRNPRTG